MTGNGSRHLEYRGALIGEPQSGSLKQFSRALVIGSYWRRADRSRKMGHGQGEKEFGQWEMESPPYC